MDDERWYETFLRLDFRGVFNTQVEGFEAAMENKISPFSLLGCEIGFPFYHERDACAQYQTNGEYIVELETGKIVYGDQSVLETIATVSKLVEAQENLFCDHVYGEVTGVWCCNGKSSFIQPQVYYLTHEQLQKSIKMFQDAVATHK